VEAVEDHAREVAVLAKVCLVSSPYKEKTKQHRKFKKEVTYRHAYFSHDQVRLYHF